MRITARLDVKGSHLIKGIQLEGLRILGEPNEFALGYYEAGIDEILYMDVVASLYGRNSLLEVVRATAQNVFVPITVGGGLRSVQDVEAALRAGADKVAINTAAIARPRLITEVADQFGSQCMVVSIEGKRSTDGRWESRTDNGRERTGREVVEWARECEGRGAGELLLTSVDLEGTRKGFDVDMVGAVSREVGIPVIASGGFGKVEHLVEVARVGGADAVAVADAFHYRRVTVAELRSAAAAAGIEVRRVVD